MFGKWFRTIIIVSLLKFTIHLRLAAVNKLNSYCAHAHRVVRSQQHRNFLSIKGQTQEFAGNLVGIKRRLRFKKVALKATTIKTPNHQGPQKLENVVGFRHFDYGGAFCQVVIGQTKDTNSVNACSEFKVIGLPSEHQKSY